MRNYSRLHYREFHEGPFSGSSALGRVTCQPSICHWLDCRARLRNKKRASLYRYSLWTNDKSPMRSSRKRLVMKSRLAGSDPDTSNQPTRTSVLPHHGCNLNPRCPPRRKQRSRHACNHNHYNRNQKRHGIGLRPVCPQVSQVSWQSGAAMHRWARASDQAGDRPGSRASFRSCRAQSATHGREWDALLPMR
jgi:hypothetical protein